MARSVQVGDVSLRKEDISLLVPPRWINDQIIAIAYEIMRTETLPGDDRFACVGPSEAFMMSQIHDASQLREFFAPLKLETRQLVLLPVCDHDDPDTAGGMHWSLLAYYRAHSSDGFYHFDSLGINRAPAEQLAERVAPLLGLRRAPVTAAPTPRQTNGYDCGMYCILISELCARHVGRPPAEVAAIITQTVTPEAVRQRRKDIIATLRAKLDGAEATDGRARDERNVAAGPDQAAEPPTDADKARLEVEAGGSTAQSVNTAEAAAAGTAPPGVADSGSVRRTWPEPQL